MRPLDLDAAPLVPAAAALAGGLAIGPVLGGGASAWGWAAALAMVGAAVCGGRARDGLLVLAVLAVGLARGAGSAPVALPEGAWWTAEVVRACDDPAEAGVAVVLLTGREGEARPWGGRLRADVQTPGWTVGPLRRGDLLLLRGRLRRRRSGEVISLWKPSRARLLPGGPGPPIRAEAGSPTPWDRLDLALEEARARVRRAIDRGATTRTRGLLQALALGDRRGIDPGLRAAFSRTGTAHLLAISGLHVGCLYAVALATVTPALRRLPWPLRWRLEGHPDRVAAGVALGAAATYVLLAGAPVSARRALVMLACVSLASITDRVLSPWNALAVAVIVVGWTDPGSVTALGFQLSVASVAGLIWAVPTMGTGGSRSRWRVRRVGQAAAGSTIATVATAPLLGMVWGAVPVAGIWANPLVVPVLGALTVPVLLAGAALALLDPALGAPLVRVAAGLAEVGVAAVEWLAEPSRAPLIPWRPVPATVGASYLAAAATVLAFDPRRARASEARPAP